MVNDRFKDALWITTEKDPYNFIFIGGAGGIGSWTSLFLARAGFHLYIADFDILEKHNLGGQIFSIEDIGKPKVEALSNIILNTSEVHIDTSLVPINIETIGYPFMISCFDNMKARKNFFESWKRSIIEENMENEGLLIDGRLSMESFQIYCVTSKNIEKYEKTLFNDDEVQDLPCTMKQTSHIAAMIASHITSMFTNHVVNLKRNRAERELPFLYEFFSPLYTFNYEK